MEDESGEVGWKCEANSSGIGGGWKLRWMDLLGTHNVEAALDDSTQQKTTEEVNLLDGAPIEEDDFD
uniref:Uncharacterized protein n=1 Tax=Cucumis melo TaxID=3656 RepID=A0A9I9D8Y9_CUCME